MGGDDDLDATADHVGGTSHSGVNDVSPVGATTPIQTLFVVPDVHVAKTADNTPITAGDTASFTITTSNAGPGIANNVVMVDNLPGTGWVENPDNPNCVIAADVLTCTYLTLAVGPGDSVTVERPTTTADCGTLPNTADVTAHNEDPGATGDNSASAEILVECPVGTEG